jgi:hypothetical protein
MISVEQVVDLAGSLGTAEGLARVNAGMESLRQHLADSKPAFSPSQLERMISALDLLSGAILSMDRLTREMLGHAGAGAIDCVG